AEQVAFAEPARKRLEESSRVGVVADEPAVALAYDRVHRSDPLGQRIETVEMGHDRLLVRHRHVAAAPGRVGAAFLKVAGELLGAHEVGAVVRIDAQLFKPVSVDCRRFRLRDRIADDLGVRPHAGSSSSSRSAPSTGSSGMPSTVNMSPSMLSNSCGPSASMRNTPTHWLTSGHSATRYFSMKASDRSRTLRRARAT